MAEQYDDVVLRIPMRPGESGGRGRGPWYAWSFVGVLVAIVGLALFGDEPRDGLPRPSEATVVAPSGGRATSSLDPSQPIASEVIRPTLPDYPNLAIAGAPGIGLARSIGNDLEVSAWWPGDDALEPVGTVRGIFTTGAPFAFVDMSPNLRYGITVGPTSRDMEAIVVRLFGLDGVLSSDARVVADPSSPDRGLGLVWPSIVWAPDSSTVALSAGPVWTVIRIDGSEISAIDVQVDPGADPSAAPDPGADRSGPIQPVAFSMNGRWLYGARVDVSVPASRPAVRVDLAARELRVEPITRYPAGGPDGLAPTRFPGPGIDPSTGRYTELVGPGRGDVELALFDADGTRLPLPDDLAGRHVSTAWLGSGRLFALREVVTDARWSLAIDWGTLERDGARSPWRTVDGRLTGGTVIAGRSGFALFGLRAGAEEMLVMLRIDDGMTGTLDIPATRPRGQTWAFMIDPQIGP